MLRPLRIAVGISVSSLTLLMLSGCGSFNQNELLTDSARTADCPPGCASAITKSADQMTVTFDSGTYSVKYLSTNSKLDVTGTCYSPYTNTSIYLQISTGVPSTSSNARTTNYLDLNTGVGNVVSCVKGRFAASVQLGSLTYPAQYYITALIQAVESGETLTNAASGGTTYIPFTVTQ